MESKFNFKSAICTSIEQSERLLALGLKKETADCALLPLTDKATAILVKPSTNYIKNTIPAWSLHRLWELTPKVIFTKPSLYLTMCEDSVFYCAEGNNEEYEKSFSRQISLYDNIIDCIEWLIKEECFNKEYLERKE